MALVTALGGRSRLVEGAAWEVVAWAAVQPLRRLAAAPTQTVEIHGIDGHVEHRQGPTSVWFNPLTHTRLALRTSTDLQGGEAVVVYRQQDDGVTRRIIHGPARFLAGPAEWLHRFHWHGSDPNDTDPANKVSGMLRFTQLRTAPDRLYFNVHHVRTADDALLTFKLILFYELVDIPRMLNASRDVIADLINAATADSIEFASERSFERFKNDTVTLNAVATYPHLSTRAAEIGYRLDKVVFRGYVASAALQTMHDGATERRTSLHLERETEEQAQGLADFQQRRAAERAAAERAEASRAAAHAHQLEDAAAAAELARRDRDQASALAHATAAAAAELDALQRAAALGADPTRYAVAKLQGRPDRLVAVEALGTAVHLHD